MAMNEVVIDRVKGEVLKKGWGTSAYADGLTHFFSVESGVISLCGRMLADDFEGEKAPRCMDCKIKQRYL